MLLAKPFSKLQPLPFLTITYQSPLPLGRSLDLRKSHSQKCPPADLSVLKSEPFLVLQTFSRRVKRLGAESLFGERVS